MQKQLKLSLTTSDIYTKLHEQQENCKIYIKNSLTSPLKKVRETSKQEDIQLSKLLPREESLKP